MMEPPAEVSAAAQAAGLGLLRRAERLVTMSFYYRVAATFVLMGAAGLGFVGWLMSSGPAPLWLQVVMLVLAFGGVGVVVWILATALRRARTVGAVDLYEYEDGFVRTKLSETTVFPWSGVDLVETLNVGGAQDSGSRRRVLLRRRQEETGRASEPLDLGRDSDRVAALVTAAALPSAVDAARSPAGVRFGALAVGPSGVTVGEKALPWPSVERVVREGDHIRVYRAGASKPWAREPIGAVPNVPVLLAVVERLRAEPGAAQ